MFLMLWHHYHCRLLQRCDPFRPSAVIAGDTRQHLHHLLEQAMWMPVRRAQPIHFEDRM